MSDQDLKKICQKALTSHGLKTVEPVRFPVAFWDASFFQVQDTEIFRSLRQEQKFSFLESMSTHILHEACSIEKAGLSYSARMNLFSTNVDEKILYALIGAEEALHLKSLEPFLRADHSTATPDFAGMIHQWIEKLERPSLLVMIQILLEGWGLSYYQSLAQNAADPQLQSVFSQILQDEARHHAMGVVLYRHENLKAAEREQLEEELLKLFYCVQIGPQQAALQLAVASGQKSIDFRKVFSEMKAFEDTQGKLDKLKRLLEKTSDERLISACLTKDLFKAHSLEQMAVVADSQLAQIAKSFPPEPSLQSDIFL